MSEPVPVSDDQLSNRELALRNLSTAVKATRQAGATMPAREVAQVAAAAAQAYASLAIADELAAVRNVVKHAR